MVARNLMRSPGHSLVSLAILSTAVGTSTLLFAIVYATLLAPSPYPDAERLVVGWGSNVSNGQLRDVVSGANYVDMSDGSTSFVALGAIKGDGAVLEEEGRPVVVPALRVTPEFFEALDVPATLGRTIDTTETFSGSEPVIVLSHQLWIERFESSPDVVGTRIRVDLEFATVIGVMGAEFGTLFPVQAYLPLYRDVIAAQDRTSYNYWMIGRLAETATIERASGELDATMDVIAETDPRLRNWSVLLEPLDTIGKVPVRAPMLALSAAVGLLALVATFNLAGLELVRGTTRTPEWAVRRALGGGRGHLVRLMVSETALLAGVGCLLSFPVATGGLRLLRHHAPATIPVPGSAAQVTSFHASFGWATLLWMALTALAIIGLSRVPALVQARGARLDTSTRTTATARMGRVRDSFVLLQLAFASALLMGAALAGSTMKNILDIDVGLAPENVLTMYAGNVSGDAATRARYFTDILGAVQQVPGVRSVGVNDYVPLQSEDDFAGLLLHDRPPPPPGSGLREEWRRVSSDYFATAGVAVLDGRGFEPADYTGGRPVAVINRAFASKHYPGADPVGETLTIWNGGIGDATIVGVVADVRRRGILVAAPPVLYAPFHLGSRGNMAVFVATEGPPEALLDSVREAIWSVDSSQPIDRVLTLTQVVDAAVGLHRFTLAVLLALAGIAVPLASLGAFGVTAFALRARRRELGIRLALGATHQRLAARVLRDAVALGVAGITGGLGLAALAGSLARSLLVGVTPYAIVPAAAVSCIVLASVIIATLIPVRGLRRVEAAESLRVE